MWKDCSGLNYIFRPDQGSQNATRTYGQRACTFDFQKFAYASLYFGTYYNQKFILNRIQGFSKAPQERTFVLWRPAENF